MYRSKSEWLRAKERANGAFPSTNRSQANVSGTSVLRVVTCTESTVEELQRKV